MQRSRWVSERITAGDVARAGFEVCLGEVGAAGRPRSGGLHARLADGTAESLPRSCWSNTGWQHQRQAVVAISRCPIDQIDIDDTHISVYHVAVRLVIYLAGHDGNLDS